jgi:signal transduction histidine kinase
VEAIRDGVADDPDALLSGMERQIGALGVLVDDLQLHTRIASGTLELRRTRVDLTEVVDEALDTVRPIASRSDVGLAIDAAARVMVDGDAAQLGRVVRNLLDNAIRHAPAGTTVRTSVVVDGARAVVRVVDDGPGFPSELHERAFDAFTRGDPARDVRTGTAGLGLAIAKGIVNAHDGAICIVTHAGGAVEFTLPRDPALTSHV